MVSCQLAQLNVARLVAPLDHPRVAGFVEALDRVNALAEAATGFLWRLKSDGGDATSIRTCDDELVIVNMSTWASIDALWAYVYSGGHLEIMRRRREWFVASADLHLVLWWRPTGDPPSLDEAMNRLACLRERGPTNHAFTFREPFGPDGRAIARSLG
jgi:Domain of unknown function (DUF3291)